MRAGVYEEIPAFLPCGEETLTAVHTRPLGGRKGIGFIFLLGRGTGGSFGRRRLTARVCRRLASEGFDALRIDYHGVGGSTGTVGLMTASRPFTADLEAGVRWLKENGIERVVLAGSCFGARTALGLATQTPGLHGVVLAVMAMGDAVGPGVERPVVMDAVPWAKIRRGFRPQAWGRLFSDPRRRRRYLGYARSLARAVVATGRAKRSRGDDYWVSPGVLEPLEELAARRVPVLCVYGSEDWSYRQYRRARSGRVGELLDAPGSSLHEIILEGKIHDSDQVEIQDELIECISEWMASLPPAPGGTEERGADAAAGIGS